MPKLESVEVVLLHCNLVNNSYQQASKMLFTFVPNKQFHQLITISRHSLTMLKTTNSELPFIHKWDIQQNQSIENMLKVVAFYHLQENGVINMVKKINGYCNKNRNGCGKNSF